jgi:hypothetical protein
MENEESDFIFRFPFSVLRFSLFFYFSIASAG